MGKKKKRKRAREEAERAPVADADGEESPREEAPVDEKAPPRADHDVRVALLVAIVALLVDLPRVCRTVSIEGDSATFTSAAATFGVPQPSGYPLYTLVGWLATKLVPFGEVPFRVHLLSAFFHAATVAVVALLVQGLTRSRAAAISGALFLAFSRAFFHASHYAEVFPLDDLFGALLLYTGIGLVDLRARDPLSRLNALVVFVLVCSLASAHHQMIALSAPALAYLLRHAGALRTAREHGFRSFSLLVVAFVLPLFGFYALLVVAAGRDPYVSWGDVHDLSSLVGVATRRDFGGLFSPNIAQVSADVSRFDLVAAWGSSFVRSFTWLGVALAAIGAFVTLRRKSRLAIACALFAFTAGPLFAALNALPIGDERGVAFVERFHTLSFVPLAVFVGAGVAQLTDWFSIVGPRSIARVVAGAAFAFPLALNAKATNLHDDRVGAALAHDLFVDVPNDAMVLVSGDAMLGAALHACAVEDACGRRVVFSPGQLHLPWKVAQLHRRHPDLALPKPAGEFLTTREVVLANLPFRPVFVAPFILDAEPALRTDFAALPVGILVRLYASDTVDPESLRDSFLDAADHLANRLEGASIRSFELPHPSLEAGIPPIYALAFENHARFARLVFDDAPTAASLEAQATAIDADFVKKVAPAQPAPGAPP